MNMSQMPQPNIEPNLDDLRREEESHRLALEEAINGKVPATPLVIEDLQSRYYLAKQAREDFEAKL
jgi:hypothetical protein